VSITYTVRHTANSHSSKFLKPRSHTTINTSYYYTDTNCCSCNQTLVINLVL